MDELQYNFGDGPCLTALREEVTVYVPDLDRERRRPRYCAVAWSEGIGSNLSIPLPLDNDAGAAINLYAGDREAFTDDDLASAQTYGAQASKSLRLAVRIAQLLSAQQNLEATMRARTIIDPAAGTIMERHHCSQDTALQTLREESNNRNRKLRDVAAEYVAKTNTHASIHTHFDH